MTVINHCHFHPLWSALSDTLVYLSRHLTCFPVLTTDDDSCIAVEMFGNYLSFILASEVPLLLSCPRLATKVASQKSLVWWWRFVLCCWMSWVMYIHIHCQKVPLCCIFTEKFLCEFKIHQNVIKISFHWKYNTRKFLVYGNCSIHM